VRAYCSENSLNKVSPKAREIVKNISAVIFSAVLFNDFETAVKKPVKPET
jgi:hypothetical protein